MTSFHSSTYCSWKIIPLVDGTSYCGWMFYMLQNFVGLSVSDGYIATGSETNEVIHIFPHYTIRQTFINSCSIVGLLAASKLWCHDDIIFLYLLLEKLALEKLSSCQLQPFTEVHKMFRLSLVKLSKMSLLQSICLKIMPWSCSITWKKINLKSLPELLGITINLRDYKSPLMVLQKSNVSFSVAIFFLPRSIFGQAKRLIIFIPYSSRSWQVRCLWVLFCAILATIILQV